LLLGPQGAGKGTQAQKIATEFGLPHIATGDLYRSAIAADNELGKQVAPILAAGRLVPDGITIPLIREKLLEAEEGFVLDGYPRNIAQANALDDLLDEVDRPLSIVLLLQLPDPLAWARLAKRAKLEGRVDDTPQVIEERLRTYHGETEPVVEHYRATGKLVQIHAERTIDEVWEEISEALDQVQARA